MIPDHSSACRDAGESRRPPRAGAARDAFTAVEVLTTAAIGMLLISVAIPAGARVREMGRRSMCATNLAGIGAAAKIYAMRHNDSWMIPPFSERAYEPGGPGVDYLNDDRTIGRGAANTDPGEVGYERDVETTNDSTDPWSSGGTAVSVTRALWMLVRTGEVSTQQYICPSSGDSTDQTVDIERYYDFDGYMQISYGYMVPYGPRDTQPRNTSPNRVILAADKSPYYLGGSDPITHLLIAGPGGVPLREYHPPQYWRPFNSNNHGGPGNGEGQNVLYARGDVAFERTPVVGVDYDNIYTVMYDRWARPEPFNLIYGDSPHVSPIEHPYPGAEALGEGDPLAFAMTDSLIYP